MRYGNECNLAKEYLQMKALKRFSNKAYDMRLTDIEEPLLTKDDWIKVKVAYAGICGSDIKMLAHDFSSGQGKLKPPVIPGHEASGVVAQIGNNVQNVKVGDRVVYMTIVDNCQHCRYCYSGDWGNCTQRKGLGSSMDGSFAEYVIMPAKNAIILPDYVSLRTACLVEPLACAIRLVEEMGKIKRGENVLVIGPGSIGAFCAITAKANGANVIVLGTKHSSHRLKIIESMGIKCMINEGDILHKVEDHFGQKADAAIEAVGKESTFTTAVDSVRVLGRVIVGAADEISDGYKVDVMKLFAQQIQIVTAVSTRPESWISAVDLMKVHHKDISKLATSVYPLQEWEAAFELARSRDAFKVMINFSDGIE